MVGILLVTHGQLGRAIRESAELLVGSIEKVEDLSLLAGQDVQELKAQVEAKMAVLDDGDGVLVLVDIPGGSPYNVTAQCIRGRQAECITGLNLPMLVEAVDSRSVLKLPELARSCMQLGADGIVDVRERLHMN